MTSTTPQADLGDHGTGVHPPQPGAGPGGESGGGLGRRRWLVLAACAVLGTAVGVTGQRLTTATSDGTAAASPSPSATAAVKATVIPVSPVESSFTKKGTSWRSQTYSDANFGNLKDGIGLLLDLGAARPLTSVAFTAETGPLTVELRAGDTRANNGKSYQLVGSPVQATGPTTMPASTGGSHRYWMIWVTKLPPSGFQARIANPVARG